jgi:hypothetical protein
VVVEAGMTSPTAHDALPSAGSAGGSVSSQTEDCCVPRFYFDVQRDAVSEPDLIGTELTSDDLVPQLALGLALEIAREALPQLMTIIVSVRGIGTLQLYQATLSLAGKWDA